MNLEAVGEWVTLHPRGVTAKEVAAAFGVAPETAVLWLGQLRRDGVIARAVFGRYTRYAGVRNAQKLRCMLIAEAAARRRARESPNAVNREEVDRVIHKTIPAGSVPPPKTNGVRSVFELGEKQ